jgi:hypothetical protein
MIPRRLSRASVVRVFRPRWSVSATGQSNHILIRCSTRRNQIAVQVAHPGRGRSRIFNEPEQIVRGRTVPCIACRLMTCSRHERSFTVTASNGSVRPEVVIREGEQLRALLPLRDLADGFGSRPSWVVSWASAAVARPCHGLVPTAQWCGMAMNDVPAASVTARRHSGISLPLSAASACC